VLAADGDGLDGDGLVGDGDGLVGEGLVGDGDGVVEDGDGDAGVLLGLGLTLDDLGEGLGLARW
jgi:hypothetical protein